MDIIYPELALCGKKNECAVTDTDTDTVFFLISEVSKDKVSLSHIRVEFSFFN